MGRKGRKKWSKSHKHQWRFVEATYSAKDGLRKVRKRCVVPGCKAEKEV